MSIINGEGPNGRVVFVFDYYREVYVLVRSDLRYVELDRGRISEICWSVSDKGSVTRVKLYDADDDTVEQVYRSIIAEDGDVVWTHNNREHAKGWIRVPDLREEGEAKK